MKKFFDEFKKQYWRNLMHSTQKKLSVGAQHIWCRITWPHKDAWRRRNEQKKSSKKG